MAIELLRELLRAVCQQRPAGIRHGLRKASSPQPRAVVLKLLIAGEFATCSALSCMQRQQACEPAGSRDVQVLGSWRSGGRDDEPDGRQSGRRPICHAAGGVFAPILQLVRCRILSQRQV